MLFLKYVSGVWQDHYDTYKAQYGDHPELIEEMLKNERFVLPASASFQALHALRHTPGNGERIAAGGPPARRRDLRPPAGRARC